MQSREQVPGSIPCVYQVTNYPFALTVPALPEELPRQKVGHFFLEASTSAPSQNEQSSICPFSCSPYLLPPFCIPSTYQLPSAPCPLLPITERSYGWKLPFFGSYFPQAQELLQGLLVILPLLHWLQGRAGWPLLTAPYLPGHKDQEGHMIG